MARRTGPARGVRRRRRTCGARRAQADPTAGATARSNSRGRNRSHLRRDPDLHRQPTVDRLLGAAAADRSRDRRSRLRLVVAEAVGVRTHLLLGARAEHTGVDIACATRPGLSALSVPGLLGHSLAGRLGGHLSHLGSRHAARLARLSIRSSRHAGVGDIYFHVQQHRRNQLRLPQPETLDRVSVGRVGPLAVVHRHRGHARS